MSKHREHTIEIEGYGPVAIRSLTKRQMTNVVHQERAGQLPVELVLKRGLVRTTADEIAEAVGDPDQAGAVLYKIADEITKRSWPKEAI